MIFTGTTERFVTQHRIGSFKLSDFLCNAIRTSNTQEEFKEVKFGFNEYDSGNFVTGWYFSFRNGKIYDPEGRFFYSVNENEALTLSGNFGTGSYEYFINDKLFCSNGSKPNLEFNSWTVICDDDTSGEGSVFVNVPIFSLFLDTPESFKHTGTFTGYLYHNYTEPISIWSGELLLADSAYFQIISGLDFESGNNILYPYTSGTIIIQHTGVNERVGEYTLGLNVYGDFGTKYLEFNSDSYTDDEIVHITSLSPTYVPFYSDYEHPETGEYYYFISSKSGEIDLPKVVDITFNYYYEYAAITGFTIPTGGTYDPSSDFQVLFTGDYTPDFDDFEVSVLTAPNDDYDNSGIKVTGITITRTGVFDWFIPYPFEVDISGTLVTGVGAHSGRALGQQYIYERSCLDFNVYLGASDTTPVDISGDLILDTQPQRIYRTTLDALKENYILQIEHIRTGINYPDYQDNFYYITISGSGIIDSFDGEVLRSGSGLIKRL